MPVIFDGQLTTGAAETVMVNVQVFEQPGILYEIVCVPAPAVAGLNVFDETPVPVYVPPPGLPPVNGNAAVFVQMPVMLPGQVTTVGDVTVIVKLQVEVHPPEVTE